MGKKGEEADKFSRVGRIENGTVVDHTPAGQAPNVIKILKIEAGTNMKVSIGMNVESARMGKKDIIKIEGRELDPVEVNKIAVIAPQATINVIKGGKVAKKDRVKLPELIDGIIRCANPGCISVCQEPKEPVMTKFHSEDPKSKEPTFRCHYCGWTMNREEAIKALI